MVGVYQSDVMVGGPCFALKFFRVRALIMGLFLESQMIVYNNNMLRVGNSFFFFLYGNFLYVSISLMLIFLSLHSLHRTFKSKEILLPYERKTKKDSFISINSILGFCYLFLFMYHFLCFKKILYASNQSFTRYSIVLGRVPFIRDFRITSLMGCFYSFPKWKFCHGFPNRDITLF